MSNELTAFAHRLERVTDPDALRRMAEKGGAAGKKAALDAAADDLGGDRAFSGLRRRAPLGAGYDVSGTAVRINFRPAGLWRLAEAGRQKSGPIRPRRASGRRAVLTPQGPRARSTYRRSRGLRTFTDAVKQAQRDVPKAAAQQFTKEVAKVVR